MKFQGYYDRALKAHDQRYARVFERMGYGTKDLQAVDKESFEKSSPKPKSKRKNDGNHLDDQDNEE